MVDFKSIYKFSLPSDQILKRRKVYLVLIQLDDQLHMNIKDEEDQLLWYEVFSMEGNADEQTYRTFFYKWVSVTGFIPVETIFLSSTQQFYILPGTDLNADTLKDSILFDTLDVSLNVRNLAQKYTIAYQNATLLQEAVKGVFDHTESYHIIEYLLSAIIDTDDFPDQYVYVFFTPGKLEVIGYKQNEFCHASIQEWTTASDVLYHLLSIMKVHDFDPHEDKVFVGGYITVDSKLYNNLGGYIKHLERKDLEPFGHLSELPELMVEHE